jgi:hypothetical protein
MPARIVVDRTDFCKFPMKMDDIGGTTAFVQIIYILRHDHDIVILLSSAIILWASFGCAA